MAVFLNNPAVLLKKCNDKERYNYQMN